MKRLCRLGALTLATLAGCGGGGGSGIEVPATPTPSPARTLVTADMQGIWETSSAGLKTSAVVLPDGQTWLVRSQASGDIDLAVAKLEPSSSGFVGSGKRYLLGTATAYTIELNASVAAKSTLSLSMTTGGVTDTHAMIYQSRYDSPATLADYAGDWSGKSGPGTLSWHISATGIFSGTSSTGCTYTGQIRLRAETKAVVDLALAQSCAGETVPLAGIALLSTDMRSATLAMTTTNGMAGWLLALTR